MAERDVVIRFRVDDQGTMQVFDAAGRKLQGLGGQTEQFSQRAGPAFSRFSAHVITVNQALDLMSRAAHAAQSVVNSLVTGPLSQVDRISKLAQAIGLTTESLSDLRTAAALSDLSLDELGRAITLLTANLASGTGQSRQLLQAMRVDIDQLQSADAILLALAERFAELPDGMTKSAAAAELLGRRVGPALIPFLNQGREGIERLIAVNRQLGGSFSTEVGRNAEEVNDKFTVLSLKIDFLKERIALGLLPVLSDTADAMLTWVSANDTLIEQRVREIVEGMAQALPVAADAMLALANSVANIGEVFAAHPALWRIFLATGAGALVGGPAGALGVGGAATIGELANLLSDENVSLPLEAGAGATRLGGRQAAGARPSRFGLGTSSATVLPSLDTAAMLAGLDQALQSTDESAKRLEKDWEELQKRITGPIAQAVAVQNAEQLATSEALLMREEARVKLAQDDLRMAELRGASQEELLRLTETLDSRELDVLRAKEQQLLLAEKLAQEDQQGLARLPIIRKELEQVRDAMERSGQHAAEFRAELEAAASVDLSRNFDRAVDAVLTRTGRLSVEDVGRAFIGTTIADVVKHSLRDLIARSSRDEKGFSLSSLVQLGGASQLFGGGAAISSLSGAEVANLSALGVTLQGGTVTTGGGLAMGAGGAGAAGLGAVAGYAAIVIAAIGAFSESVKRVKAVKGILGTTDAEVQAAATGGAWAGALGALGLGSLGEPLGKALERNPKLAWVVQNIAIPGYTEVGLFQAKTPGPIVRKALGPMLTESGFPRAAGQGTDVQQFPSLTVQEQFARAGFPTTGSPQLFGRFPEGGASEFRAGAIGLGALLFGGKGEDSIAAAINTGNTLINNLNAIGVSAEEAQRQLLGFAQRANIDLPTALQQLNGQLQAGEVTTQQFLTTATGLVDLFSLDLPPGVNVAQAVLDNFIETEKGGYLDIARFNTALATQVTTFARLQQAGQTGLGSALSGGLTALVSVRSTRDRILAGGPDTIADVVEQAGRVRTAFLEPLFQSLSAGLETAVVDSLFAQLTDSAEWKAVEEAAAAAVTGGLENLPALIGEFIDASATKLDAAAQKIQAVRDAFALTPTALWQGAEGIRGEVEAGRFNALDRRGQERFLRGELADIEPRIQSLMELANRGLLDAAGRVQLAQLIEQRGEIGLSLAANAGERYSGPRRRRAMEEGWAIAESSADMLEQFGDLQAQAMVATADNTAAINAQTVATTALTAVMSANPAGLSNVTINIDGARVNTDDVSSNFGQRVTRVILSDPGVRKAIATVPQ